MLHCTRRPLRWLAAGLLLAAPLTRPAAAQEGATRTVLTRQATPVAQLLAGAGIPADQAAPALTALAGVLPETRLPAGRAIMLRHDAGGDALLGLAIEARPGRLVTVTRLPTGWVAQDAAGASRRHLVMARGRVRTGLYDDLRGAGLPEALARDLVDSLAHDVDFARDLPEGADFTILFERYRDRGGALLGDGRVLHAGFTLAGRRLSLWRHDAGDGDDWYDPAGRSLRRAFLRTPLDGAQVSSPFGPRRHPVLGYRRGHEGIDFAAPRGTPVQAAAAGEVIQVGAQRGYGRLVALRHADGRETRYAHLSAVAPGLRIGDRLRQGQVLGRVGATGRATGPHLHFEVLEAGRAIDPGRLANAPAAWLEGPALQRFLAARLRLETLLAGLAPLQEVAAAD